MAGMRRVSHFVEALVALTLVACGGGSAEAPPPAAPAATDAPPVEAKAAPADSAAPAAEAAPAASEGSDSAAAAGDPDKRTMEIIAATVKTHRKEARDCYEKAQKQIPGLKGDLVVHFVLKPSGKVKIADLNKERSTITEASVVSCVIDVITAIDFPKSSRGMETTVNYPFNFNP
jgi:hypothetical protein